jgi:hypothetical protein
VTAPTSRTRSVALPTRTPTAGRCAFAAFAAGTVGVLAGAAVTTWAPRRLPYVAVGIAGMWAAVALAAHGAGAWAGDRTTGNGGGREASHGR